VEQFDISFRHVTNGRRNYNHRVRKGWVRIPRQTEENENLTQFAVATLLRYTLRDRQPNLPIRALTRTEVRSGIWNCIVAVEQGRLERGSDGEAAGLRPQQQQQQQLVSTDDGEWTGTWQWMLMAKAMGKAAAWRTDWGGARIWNRPRSGTTARKE
jgi:hypothetical protein